MSILSGGGRTYGFDLDLIKLSSSSSGRSSSSSSSSSPSSTISESSISTKRPRAPRKRPNQSYTEAAALLSTINPSLFSSKNLQKLSKHYKPTLSPLLPSSDLLPPFPVLNESGFLIEDPSPLRRSPIRFEFKLLCPSTDKSCVEYQDPGSSECSDCDVESILDEEVGEGIDSIMGNLSVENCESQSSYLRGKGDFGFGLWRKNIRQAIRGAHTGDWWRPMTAVLVRDIIPMFKALPAAETKKTKKKKKKIEDIKDEPEVISAKTKDTASSVDVELKRGLGLKLNHEDVVKAWSDREFPISTESGAPESSADVLARLADIDLLPENEGGVREASVQRYKEKRRNRLFSKKIRYQVRKVNADHRPRMKGRFVKRPDLLQEAIEEESQ